MLLVEWLIINYVLSMSKKVVLKISENIIIGVNCSLCMHTAYKHYEKDL